MSEDTGAGNDDAAAAASEPTAVRRTLDLFVFAPVGLVLTAVEDLPGLIAKGRERVETEVRNARAVGEFVVTQGQQEITQRVGRLLHSSGPGAVDDEPVATTTSAEPTVSSDPNASSEATTSSEPPAPPTPKPAPDPADSEAVERALAGYDTLSASQVVRRLESLGPEELRAVYRHETSHRNRRTILNRTGQLLEDSPAAP